MLRVVLLSAFVFAGFGIVGCGGDPEPTATEPQAPGQMAKSDDQKMEYLIEMLHRKNSEKKNAQAARELGRMGAFAKDAIPELQKAVQQTSDDKVRTDAQAAIKEIETAAATAQ
ncbi:hypothetical protein CA51_21750 [Rosistilla oblonga]|uniref:HEAT repeat domain-containing protein n=1 Tax=Rosistilla oblonga TaxID=2527990 RepID=UPI0011896D04|nr:HEAT repeat domain-containing protein [Rosistilla oblonga]QDV12293.1 hypothetical protein CA51_21750 [Rosistilla oblonga]